jgi:hypothetical protein
LTENIVDLFANRRAAALLSRALLVGALGTVALTAGCGGDAPAAERAADTPAPAPASAPVPPTPPPSATIHGPPPLVFEPQVLDIGLLAIGASGTGSVKVRNAGDVSVTIQGTRASCACAYAQDLAGTVLAPGEAVDLTATLTPKPGPGAKKEQIRVIAAGYSQVVAVDVIGEVSLSIRATPSGLEAYRIGLTGEVVVASLDGKPFRILRAGGKPPQFVDFVAAADAPRDRYALRWDLNGYTAQTMPWYWVVETDHPDAPLVDIRVMHEWTKVPRGRERWIGSDLRILGGVLRPGESRDYKTKLQYNPKGRPDTAPPIVRALTRGIRADLVSSEIIGTDIHCTFRVTVLRNDAGLLYEKIGFTAGGYSSPVWFIATLDS